MTNKFLTADYTLIQIQSMRWLKQKLKTFVFKGTVLKKESVHFTIGTAG